jgi:hypothetical protein
MMFFHFSFGEKAQEKAQATALGFRDRYEILEMTVLMWDYHI